MFKFRNLVKSSAVFVLFSSIIGTKNIGNFIGNISDNRLVAVKQCLSSVADSIIMGVLKFSDTCVNLLQQTKLTQVLPTSLENVFAGNKNIAYTIVVCLILKFLFRK